MRGKKIKYHINGTKIDLESREKLAKWLNCAPGTIIHAEKRDYTLKSFYVKGWRIKKI